MIEIAEDLESAADGAFVIDRNLKIVYANQSAREILGTRPDAIIDSYCFQILRGRDAQTRLLCHEHCQVAKKIFSGERVSNYDIQIPTRSQGKRWMNVSVFHYFDRKDGQPYVVHLFRDITDKKDESRFVERLIEAARHYHSLPPDSVSLEKTSPQHKPLTPREHEVLVLLAKGYGTRELAQQLSISVNTTRNHIQHTLQKLGVHTRLEAVTYAIKNNLLE